MSRVVATAALSLACWLAPARLAAQDQVEDQVRALLQAKDDADPALVERIAASKDRRGAVGLAKAFDAVGSLQMKRTILGALAGFAGVPEAAEPALQKLAEIAGTAEDPELRAPALLGLGQAGPLGRHFLKQLVDAEGNDAVREAALREHIKQAAAEDAAWYRQLWNLKQEQRKTAAGQIAPPELGPIRQLAFQGVQAQLGDDELVDAMRRETDAKIRRRALEELQRRASPKLFETAEWLLARVDVPGADRIVAARILFGRDRQKAAEKFLDLAKKRDVTPDDLRSAMAGLLAGAGDEALDKRLAKLLGKGKPHEKVFAIEACQKQQDPKVLALLRKGLADPDDEVRAATAAGLGARGDREALPELRAMLAKPRFPGDQRLAVEAIGAITGVNSAWRKELVGLCASADREVRNAALAQLGSARDAQHLPTLLDALAHADWSTRFAALEAVAGFRDKVVVARLVERIGSEEGRLKKRLAEVLWSLTAQPYDEDHQQWAKWWAAAAAEFAVPSVKDVEQAAERREQQRLAARTRAKADFFGIRVESRRVIFVLDVSGSMLESMYGRYVGKRGAARIDVAKQELQQAIRNLEPGALFNVFAFSSGVMRWRKDGIGTGGAIDRAAALEWVERLGANGATNLFDSLEEAFADPDVDTIFVLSDGEPTNGKEIDPHRIRKQVAAWNQHRRVVVHTIAVGGNLEVLEWLAKDSGGTYVQMR